METIREGMSEVEVVATTRTKKKLTKPDIGAEIKQRKIAKEDGNGDIPCSLPPNYEQWIVHYNTKKLPYVTVTPLDTD